MYSWFAWKLGSRIPRQTPSDTVAMFKRITEAGFMRASVSRLHLILLFWETLGLGDLGIRAHRQERPRPEDEKGAARGPV